MGILVNALKYNNPVNRAKGSLIKKGYSTYSTYYLGGWMYKMPAAVAMVGSSVSC